MIRLLSSELLRARSRKLVKVLLIVGLIGIVVGVTIGAFNSSKPTAAALAKAERQRAGDFQRCVSRPVPGLAPGQVVVGTSLAEVCTVPLRTYLSGSTFDVNDIGELLRGTSINIIVIGWLVGASLAGAEWAAGTMTTLLAWEPRRIRVLLAKLVAAIVTVLVLIAGLIVFNKVERTFVDTI